MDPLKPIKFVCGIFVMGIVWATFVWLMFIVAAYKANAFMGASDQTENERKLSECGTDTECAEAYDAVYGQGASEALELLMRECGAPSPGANCPLDENGKLLWGVDPDSTAEKTYDYYQEGE